jgi:hypothetical protein
VGAASPSDRGAPPALEGKRTSRIELAAAVTGHRADAMVFAPTAAGASAGRSPEAQRKSGIKDTKESGGGVERIVDRR